MSDVLHVKVSHIIPGCSWLLICDAQYTTHQVMPQAYFYALLWFNQWTQYIGNLMHGMDKANETLVNNFYRLCKPNI